MRILSSHNQKDHSCIGRKVNRGNIWKVHFGLQYSVIYSVTCSWFKKDKSKERYNHNGPKNVQIKPL